MREKMFKAAQKQLFFEACVLQGFVRSLGGAEVRVEESPWPAARN